MKIIYTILLTLFVVVNASAQTYTEDIRGLKTLNDARKSIGKPPLARPEEGGEVEKNDKGNRFLCDKAQDATYCKRIPLTDVVKKKGGTGTQQIVGPSTQLNDANPGKKYLEPAANFTPAREAGKFLTKFASMGRKDGKIVWKLLNPVKVNFSALNNNKDIIFK